MPIGIHTWWLGFCGAGERRGGGDPPPSPWKHRWRGEAPPICHQVEPSVPLPERKRRCVAGVVEHRHLGFHGAEEQTQSCGRRPRRGALGPAANGGARWRSGVAGCGGAPSRPDTASRGAPLARVRLGRVEARGEEEEGEDGRSRGSAPTQGTVALASPVARRGRKGRGERMGKGEGCRS